MDTNSISTNISALQDLSLDLISICIANYNGIDFIDSCIHAIKNQSTKLSYEIIVHDDASTDGSAEYIQKKYPEIILIQSDINVGFCVSNNRMAKHARGRFLLFLNNDAMLFPDALEILHQYSQQFEAAILGLPQYNANTKGFIDAGSSLDLFLNPIPNKLSEAPNPVAMIIGACLWVPRAVWHKIGGFPTVFHTLAEDMYLCCAARLAGYQTIALHRSGFYHHVGKSLGGGKVRKNKLQTSLRRRILSERNKTFVMLTTYPTPTLCIIFPLHSILLIIEGLLLSLIKLNPILLKNIYLHALKETWKKRKNLLSIRRKTVSSHNISTAKFFSKFKLLPHKLKMLIAYGIPSISS